MDSFFDYLSSSLLGDRIAPDHLKLAVSILSTYPSAILFTHLKSSNIRHAFSIAYTSFILLYVLKMYDGFTHTLIVSMSSYLLLRSRQVTSTLAWVNFTLVMFSMSVCHIGRQWKGLEGDTKLDYSGAMMILTIKLSSFGFNVMDGTNVTEKTERTKHMEEMKIAQYPTLLEYFGWVFYFGGFLTGPTCYYMDYFRFIELRTVDHPGKGYAAWKRLLKSLAFMGLLLYLAPTFNYFEALKPAWKQRSFWYKMGFIQLSGFLTRGKYYCIWYLSEGACILSGFGYHAERKEWNLLTNVNELDVEFAQSYKQLTENWNIGANHWLRNYVYLRFKKSSTMLGTTWKTYIISAMWHGFQPGFYLFFLILSSMQLLARQARRTLRPLCFTAKEQQPITYRKTIYDFFSWFLSLGFLNMMVPCFDLLYISRILVVWREVYYCHLIIAALAIAVFFTVLKPRCQAIQKRRVLNAQVEQLSVGRAADSTKLKNQ
ncbi:MBOAT, membrane-bound O-acyltransferase family-domain-containing protein [Mycotypha africana]|uniref:MBOAT, membrane-bound O-acyltransferase family-domain-containing protein n=1 Tax=Mycotypha africana TaxID=64632 RepID=UPI0023017812|nr:MBOAT, membrane-bound O-acyltransferase family-domain-containing protein [Mycotypha africana]KAI8979241.1 MBOAT, membrane-bound O-acyltransferase family-domain-containing protein [Mycotypha africana]